MDNMHTAASIPLELQFFAEAGSNVNATGGMTNAYTGEVVPRSAANLMSPELKEYYDTELLENARPELRYAQFGKKQKLPKNHGGTVEWRKWNAFRRAGKLTEAVIPSGQDFGVTKITGSVDQYGTYTAISDKLELRAHDDVILGATEEMGASAAETQEILIRNALLTGTNVLYCDNLTLATGAVHDTPAEARELRADETCMAKLTPAMINKAVTIMKKNRVPKIKGYYYAVVHPSVAHDLRECPGWIEAYKYVKPSAIYNGEIGVLHGCRFVENPDAPVLKGADLASDSRSLKINKAAGYTGAITSVAFDGGSVAADALIGRVISINGVSATVTDNDASTISFASTNFGTVADNTDIFPADYGPGDIAAYATFLFGKDAFGIIDPEGGALEMIVHDKDEIGGPLNQFSTIGYKFETNGATILYPERLLRVMSTSSFSGTDEANC